MNCTIWWGSTAVASSNNAGMARIERLTGHVEVDETYIAITERGKPRSKVGRKSRTDNTLVAVAVEILDPEGFGRIRLKRIPTDSERYVVYRRRRPERPPLYQSVQGHLETYRSLARAHPLGAAAGPHL
jgi:hypothetical protein